MTQQNETDQGTAAPEQPAAPGQPWQSEPSEPGRPSGTGQPSETGHPSEPGQRAVAASQSAAEPAPSAPFFPSPYLDGGEGLPQTYLAPPQPDQPRYGTPAGSRGRPVGRPFGPGQPGTGQQGNGQPGNGLGGNGLRWNGRAGYGQPGERQAGGGQQAGRPGPGIRLGATARRDPTLAPPWQRLVASILDWIIITLVSVIAFWSPLSDVVRQLRAVSMRYPDLTSPAAQAAINSISRDSANQHALLYWFLGIFGIALIYYWVQHAAWGATLGKRALGMRVVRAADQSRIGVLTAGLRTVAFLAGPAMFLLLISPINVLGGVLWAADAGLPLLDARAQALHDKLAGTTVIRQRPADQRSRPPSPW